MLSALTLDNVGSKYSTPVHKQLPVFLWWIFTAWYSVKRLS
jgi:hypothetical protein